MTRYLLTEERVRGLLGEAYEMGHNDAFNGHLPSRSPFGLLATLTPEVTGEPLPVIRSCGMCPEHGLYTERYGDDRSECCHPLFAGDEPHFIADATKAPPSWCPLRNRTNVKEK